jgi:serine phosphatase RsbU (regulator of sigma subunit)
MTSRTIDPVLARQLKRVSLPAELETSPEWRKFVDNVNEHYLHMAEDRALLSRSIELSTREMDGLRRRVESQRDQLVAAITGISESLTRFTRLLQAGKGTLDAAAATNAKLELASQLSEILDATRISSERTTDVSGIRDSVLAVADQLVSLLASAGERASMHKELEVARTVQQLLMPPQAVVSIPPLRFAGHFQPAEECGGDWWTLAQLPNSRSLVVVGDVAGHGIASAIITGAAKAACQSAIDVLGANLTPSALLVSMNRTLCSMTREQLSMTSIAALFDPVTNTMTVANAGHPFPILVRNSITHPIMAEGPPLGAGPDSAYEDSKVEIRRNDLLLYFTDGVSECENAKGEQFSERRLRSIVQREAASGAVAVRTTVVNALDAFRGTHPASDDLTIVVASVE